MRRRSCGRRSLTVATNCCQTSVRMQCAPRDAGTGIRLQRFSPTPRALRSVKKSSCSPYVPTPTPCLAPGVSRGVRREAENRGSPHAQSQRPFCRFAWPAVRLIFFTAPSGWGCAFCSGLLTAHHLMRRAGWCNHEAGQTRQDAPCRDAFLGRAAYGVRVGASMRRAQRYKRPCFALRFCAGPHNVALAGFAGRHSVHMLVRV